MIISSGSFWKSYRKINFWKNISKNWYKSRYVVYLLHLATNQPWCWIAKMATTLYNELTIWSTIKYWFCSVSSVWDTDFPVETYKSKRRSPTLSGEVANIGKLPPLLSRPPDEWGSYCRFYLDFGSIFPCKR